MQIVVKFGSDQYTRNYPNGTTIGQVLNDVDLKAVTGWGDNVRGTISGVEQPINAVPPEGATVNVETRANDKAKVVITVTIQS